MIIEDLKVFVKNHKELFSILGLLFVCYFLYFFKMGSYPLIDVDETRYVAMAKDMFHSKDFLTLYLNGEYFFEKPPLYFWLESLSFFVFNHVSEFTARFPVALTATFGVLITYAFSRKIVSRKYGLICALIMATSFEYVLLARVAILDMLLTVCITASVICGFYTLFCKESLRKYFWWLAYIFAGFGVLAKGVPGVLIPMASIFLAYFTARRLKELFKPLYLIPGIIMFLLVSLPWHIIMFKMYDPFFFNEYIMKHHLSRFVDSKDLGRKEPWYFLVLVFAACFVPWLTSFVAQIIVFFKKFKGRIKGYFLDFNECSQFHQFMVLNAIHFFVVFLFFSSASTKLPTYILPAFFPAAMMLGKFWYDYIFEEKNKKALNISTIVLCVVLITAALAALIVPAFLPSDINSGLFAMQPSVFAIFSICPLLAIYAVIKNKRKLHFSALVGFIVIISMIASTFIFKYVTAFGQDDLIKFSTMAKEAKAPLASYGFGKRYSMIYYYDNNVHFISEENYKQLKDFAKENSSSYIIIKNKFVKTFDKNNDFVIIEKGAKYTLIKNMVVDGDDNH